MNKKIRSIISIIAMICLLATQFVVFAEDATGTETLSLTEQYAQEVGNKWVRTSSDYDAYAITGSAANSVTSDGVSVILSSKLGILYKFPMPKPEAGQKIGKYIIRLSICKYSNMDVLKFPGEYSDVTSLRNNIEPFKSAIENYATNSAVDKDASGNKIIVQEASGINYLGQEVSRVFFDITSYVNELYAAGQRDHFYVIAGSVSSTRKMLANRVYSANTADDFVQASFHSFEQMPLTEMYAQEVGNKWVRSTSDYNAYAISGSAANSVTSDGSSTKLSSAAGILYKFPMPKPGAGQKIEKYIIRISICDYSTMDVLKFPGEYSDVTSFRNNAEPYKSVIANYATNSAVDKDENGNKLIVREASGINYLGQEVSRVFFDITSYVNELYNAGQRDHFYVIVGSVSSTRKMLANAVYSANIRDEFVQASFHNFAPADELALSEVSPAEGEVITASTPVSFTFNNGIESASVTLNGKAAECSISGNKVTVTSALSQYEDYTVSVSATDVYGTTKEFSSSFSTTSSFESGTLKSGLAYHVTASNDPNAPTSGKYNINKANSNAMVYRLPVPQMGEGEILGSYIFKPMINTWSSTIYPSVYKMTGDNWEFTEDKNDDGVLLRYSDISGLFKDANLACRIPDERKTSTFENEFFLHEYDITSYANECIANGEDYIDLVLVAGSTVNLYGFVTENWASKYAPTFEYSLIVPELKVESINKTLNGATLSAFSIKLFTNVDSAVNKVVIRNAETKEIVNASFAWDATRRQISLASAAQLNYDSSFEIVLKACSDIYGNTISEDIVVATIDIPKAIIASVAKIVASSYEGTYDDATSNAILDKSSAYKAVAKISNNTSESIAVVVAVAEYNGSSFADVEFECVTVPANTADFDVASKALALSGNAGEAKAFVWLATDITPLADAQYASIN